MGNAFFLHDPSRRRFLKATVIAGVSVWIAPLDSPAYATLFEESILRPGPWHASEKTVGFRVDGTAKVTGGKVFARDVRAWDMPHWPARQSHAMLLRATVADRVFEGIDLGSLDSDLRPDSIVTAQDLARDKLAFPAFYGTDMLLPAGQPAAYLGHAVAILIYHDFARYRAARQRLQFNPGVVRYGAPGSLAERPPWGATRLVRVEGTTPYDEDVYSALLDAPLDADAQPDAPGMRAARDIAEQLDHPPDDWLVMTRRYQTQSMDTVALEPDNANCWYDRDTRSLHMIVASQSPLEVAENAAAMVNASRFPVDRLFMHPCYTVGYGSKDHCNVPFYGLVAALYGDDRPVRYAVDRYEHFQTALKRHAVDTRSTIAVDRRTGLFQVLKAVHSADGGGRANFSASVVEVCAAAAPSVYYFPRSDIAAVAHATRAVDAGSARGYGTLQSMTATEILVDEVSSALTIDAIDLRLRNVLKSGMKNANGSISAGAMRTEELLLRARQHPLWRDRARSKAQFDAAHPGSRYGVGFACVHKNFGSGGEAAFAHVALTPEGKIILHHTGVEIGTGMATSQAVLCARWLGRPADEVRTAVRDWPELPLHATGDPFTISQAEQDRLAADPHWTPSYASPSSASNSAYFMGHATLQTAQVVFEHGLWPAAVSIWSEGTGGGQAASNPPRMEDARWTDGRLTANGMQPLTLEELARRAFDAGLVTGAVGHVFNRWQWAQADFTIAGMTRRRQIDGLAVRHGMGSPASPDDPAGYRVVARSGVAYPPVQRGNAGATYHSGCAALVALSVSPVSGEVRLLTHHSILECGTPIVEQLVSGQQQGGVAMGIGYALHEYLPLYEDGPGNGTWNLDRYHLPRASDVAVWTQTSEILAPLSESDPPKGIAEVVMIPIVPAIVNAIAHAIGHHIRELPITPRKIREVLET